MATPLYPWNELAPDMPSNLVRVRFRGRGRVRVRVRFRVRVRVRVRGRVRVRHALEPAGAGAARHLVLPQRDQVDQVTHLGEI